MSKFPIVKIIFDRRKVASDKKKGSFEIEVSHGMQRVRFSTGVRVFKNQHKNGTVIGCLDAVELNSRLAKIKEAVERRINEMIDKGCINLAELRISLETINIDLFKWIEERIELRPLRYSTQKQHKVMLNNLKSFGKIKSFADLTVANLKQWDEYIRKSVTTQSSVHGYHKRLKPYINEAVQFGYIKENPYSKFKVERGKVDKISYLNEDERKEIEKLKLSGIFDDVRDCFIFSCYTGLAFADLERFSWDKVETVDGNYYIYDERQKTNTAYKIKLLPPAVNILKKHGYKLPMYTNQTMNRYLKIIADSAGVNKNLTMHMARHTFATWALSQGVRIEVVSKMLAHSDIKTTQLYAKILQDDVDKGFEFLEDKLKNKK